MDVSRSASAWLLLAGVACNVRPSANQPFAAMDSGAASPQSRASPDTQSRVPTVQADAGSAAAGAEADSQPPPPPLCAPADCADGNACTTDSCSAGLCSHVANTLACDDGNACTSNDVCKSGVCLGAAMACDDGNPCSIDLCSAATGQCSHTPSATLDGTACPPSGGCSSGQCQAGLCMAAGCPDMPWPWTVPDQFAPAKHWFDPVGYHVAALSLPAASWTAFLAEVKSGVTTNWHQADAVIDGVKYGAVGIRAFGYGSLAGNPGKPNIRINFNKFTPGLHGPEGLHNVRFKASGQDPTFLREPVVYAVSRALGGAAPRSSWARVSVNGQAFGLFIVLEHVDSDLAAAHFGNGNGQFYTQVTGCVGLNCPVSGCADVTQAYDLGDASGAALSALASAIHDGSDTTWLSQLQAIVNLPNLLVFYAMDVLTSNVDGMTTAGNNFEIYAHPDSGQLYFFHHGMDLVLGNWNAWLDFQTPWGPPCDWCQRDQDDFYARLLATPVLKSQMWGVFKKAHCGPFGTAAMLPTLDKLKALIAEDLVKDPKGILTKAQIDADFKGVIAYVTERNQALDTLVGPCP